MKTAVEIETDALRTINMTRRYFGQEPLRALPPGEVSEAGDCPIQRAWRDIGLGSNIKVREDRVCGVNQNLVPDLVAVWGNPGRARVKASLNEGEVPLPKSLRRFVRAFDREELLHLSIDAVGDPEQADFKESAVSALVSH